MLDRGYALTHPDHPLLGANGAAVLRAVAERIHARGPIPERDRGLIHGDLHRENMLLTPNGSIAVIDFDDCGLGAYTLDIATVLSSIHRLCRNDSEAYADFAYRFLTAYEKIRPLPESMDRFEDFLLLRDTFIVNFVTSSTNTEVATWGPRRPDAGTPRQRHLPRHPHVLTATPRPPGAPGRAQCRRGQPHGRQGGHHRRAASDSAVSRLCEDTGPRSLGGYHACSASRTHPAGAWPLCHPA
ncbi:phosphotransferase [Streptomyces goshikiensis]|uniref:phosphotransferase n=1 Tax=Streptomyces goshikiensis TaxID=1942 RepID=UPI0036D785A7